MMQPTWIGGGKKANPNKKRRARQDLPSRSREALTSLYKAPERYYSEYIPEFLYRIPGKFQLEFLLLEQYRASQLDGRSLALERRPEKN